MQYCTRVLCCDNVNWNIIVCLRIEQERDVEPCSWVIVVGSDVTVELNLCTVDDCRSNEPVSYTHLTLPTNREV